MLFTLLTLSQAGVAALSWDAFPEAPPKAASWTPDPNYIARPGVLKDPRFNKDPHAEHKKAAMKREMRLRGFTDDTDDTSRSSSSSVGPTVPQPELSKWPALVIRSTYPDALTHSQATPIATASEPDSAPISLQADTPSLSIPAHGRTGRTMQAQARPFVPASAPVVSTEKGSMENFPVRPLDYSHIRSPTASKNLPRSESPVKNGMPIWAASLEKLLAEGLARERSLSVQPPTISTPPHKRKADTGSVNGVNDVNGVNGVNGINGVSGTDDFHGTKITTPKATVAQGDDDLEALFKAADATSRRVSGNAAPDTKVGQAETVQAQITALPKDDDDLQLSAQYQRSLDIAQIRYMENDLDLGTHGTKAELILMDESRLKAYFDRVKAAHKQLWMCERSKA